MRKITALVLIGIMLLSSISFAQSELPDNYLIIGDKIVDLNYAINNKNEFNTILVEFLQNGGSLDDLYASIAGSFQNVFGNVETEEKQSEVLASCKVIIDAENPNGKLLEPQMSAKVNVRKLEFGPSTIFTVNVISVENIEGAVGFILGEETNQSVLFGKEETYSSITGDVNIYIVDAEDNILAQGVIKEEGNEIIVELEKVDSSKEDFKIISIY